MVVFKEHQLSRIRQRNRVGLYRESEGFILPFEGMGQHNPVRGKEPCFVHATKERRVVGDCRKAIHSMSSSGRY